MDGATARTGIGRRRGAAASIKSPSTSVIVAVVSFSITSCVILLMLMCVSMPSSTTRPRGSSSEPAPLSLKATRKKGGAGHRVDKLPPTKAFEEIVGRVPRQRGGGGNDDGDEFARIVNAELDLVAIDTDDIAMTHAEHGSKYRGVTATFCKLHWDKYKMDPPSMPMFKMLVQESGCDRGENLFTMDLADVAGKLDESENEEESMGISVMPPAGFVFHESRVGSTLVANALTAMDPDGHRVYSESDPINRALAACGDGFTKCDMETNVELLRDVVFLMGRTPSPSEKRMFFKVSSVGSKRIDVMRQAFEYVPWLFVFRDPVQTMMSHIDPAKKKTVRGGLPPAVCLRSRHRPADDLRRLVFLNNPGKQAEQLSDEEFCAAHLVRLHSIWMGHLFHLQTIRTYRLSYTRTSLFFITHLAGDPVRERASADEIIIAGCGSRIRRTLGQVGRGGISEPFRHRCRRRRSSTHPGCCQDIQQIQRPQFRLGGRQ